MFCFAQAAFGIPLQTHRMKEAGYFAHVRAGQFGQVRLAAAQGRAGGQGHGQGRPVRRQFGQKFGGQVRETGAFQRCVGFGAHHAARPVPAGLSGVRIRA